MLSVPVDEAVVSVSNVVHVFVPCGDDWYSTVLMPEPVSTTVAFIVTAVP